nr:hypothetical protein [uncultured Rhodopila sp.]
MVRFLIITLVLAGIAVAGEQYLYANRWQAPVSLSLQELMQNPGPYDGKSVSVRGTVVNRMSVMGAGGFRIAGPAGEAITIIGFGVAPPPGELVTVHGVFHIAATVGVFQVPVILVR